MKKLLLLLALISAESHASTYYFEDTSGVNSIGTKFTTVYSTGKMSGYLDRYTYLPSVSLKLKAAKSQTVECYLVVSTNETSAVVDNTANHTIVGGPYWLNVTGTLLTYAPRLDFTLFDDLSGIRHTKFICRGSGVITMSKNSGYLKMTVIK